MRVCTAESGTSCKADMRAAHEDQHDGAVVKNGRKQRRADDWTHRESRSCSLCALPVLTRRSHGPKTCAALAF